MSFALSKCPLCGASDQSEIYLTRDRHYGISGSYRVVRCLECSLVFLNPMFSDQELSSLYPDDYYAYQDNFHDVSWKRLVKAVLGYRIGTSEPAFPRPGRLLDLGCGAGKFLASARERGWEVHGVEINAAAAALGRNSAGLDIHPGRLETAKFPPEYFDYVRSNHSFEHISCPCETLAEIHRILRPAGKLLIGVPNIAGLNARIFGQYWWYLGVPVHPFSYSSQTLTRLLHNQGFEVERVTYNSDYSGILGSLQIWLNRHDSRKSDQGFFINNRAFRVASHWLAKLTDCLGMGDAIEIIARKSISAVGRRTAVDAISDATPAMVISEKSQPDSVGSPSGVCN